MKEIEKNQKLIKQGKRLSEYLAKVKGILEKYQNISDFEKKINIVVTENIADSDLAEKVLRSFSNAFSDDGRDIDSFLRYLSVKNDSIEQDVEGEGVRLLTMHQAKGLTFDVCIIVGVEDEYLPGKNENSRIDDERRLLYVSMTRARHKLYMTYCDKRIGDQRHTGSNSGVEARTLSRFLRDVPGLSPMVIQ